jgi:hypothetical protein
VKLHIQIAGDKALIPVAKQAWNEFETSIALPFAYDKPAEVSVCDDTEDSDLAECQVTNGVAVIRIKPAFLDVDVLQPLEQNLTLLHESLHIASFTGTLRDMYAAVNGFTEAYGIHCQIARRLGKHLFEVDAEFALRDLYSEHLSDRTAYCVRQTAETIGHWYSDIPSTHRVRPYYVLLDQLRAELLGLLAGDESVTRRLCSSVELASEPTDEIAALHRMLSPKCNNFADLPRWGAATYEAVIRRVTEALI